MPLTTSSDRYKIILVISVLLAVGFLATSITSYQVSKTSIREAIVANELPLTSDTIYSEIQRDLVRPVLVSSTMAQDTFVRDWLIQGEHDPDQITKYLETIRGHYGAFTSFLVSEKTRRYYQSKGVLKSINENEPRDVWYFRVKNMTEPYEINVDPDLANGDKLTIFINYRLLDYQGKFIGVTGVGLTVDAVSRLLGNYRARFGRSIYFTDEKGNIILGDSLPSGSNLHSLEGLSGIAETILKDKASARYQYQRSGNTHLLNVRYVPELKWFLCVERIEEEALGTIRRTLLMNIATFAVVTISILLLVAFTLNRYHSRMEEMATTDALTGLFNRRAFDLHLRQGLEEARRRKQPLTAVMIDIDHFKRLNDEKGHLAGDMVLRGVADLIRKNLRQSDVACRWGGEEIFLLLKDVNEDGAVTVAEKIRAAIESASFGASDIPISTTISAGVAELHGDSETGEHMVARADKALYAAKLDGRNRVCRDSTVA